MAASERGLPFSTDGLVDEYGQWTVPSYKNEAEISGGAGKRAAVRAGGSASRTSGDQSSTDPGVSAEISNGNPIGAHRGKIVSGAEEFPSLEARQRTAGNTRGSAGPSTAEVDWRPTGPPTPVLRNLDRGMRPAKDFQSVPQRDSNTRTRVQKTIVTPLSVQKTIVTPLSALAENFIPRKTSRKQSTPQVPTDNELDRSFAKTGPGKIETPQDIIESDIATIGAAYPTEIEKPVAVADVAGASGPAITGAGGPVVAGTRFLAVTDVTGSSGPAGTGAGGPVVTGTRFRTVTDVAEASGPAITGAGGPVVTGTRFRAVTDVAGASGPAVTGAGGPVVAGTGFRAVTDVAGASGPAVTGEGADVSDGLKKRNLPESLEIYTDPAPVRKASEEEPIEYSAPSGTPNEGSEPLNTDCLSYVQVPTGITTFEC